MEESLEARVARLERLVDRLTEENVRLRSGAPSDDRIPRRGLLKGAAVAAAGAGIAMLGTTPAAASTGGLQYGASNDAGADATSLTSISGSGTLAVYNQGAASGDPSAPFGLFALSHAGTGLVASSESEGSGLLATVQNPSNQAAVYGMVTKGVNVPALKGSVEGAGPGVDATSTKGIGVWGHLGSKNPSDAVRGITSGSGSGVAGVSYAKGPGVSGSSDGGRGGVFAGAAAQVQLKPSGRTTHPSAGKRGDLFVDASGRLWFCKTGGAPATWTQLA